MNPSMLTRLELYLSPCVLIQPKYLPVSRGRFLCECRACEGAGMGANENRTSTHFTNAYLPGQASTKQQPEPFLAGSIRGPEKSPEGSSISRVPWPISMRDGYIQPSPPSGAALCAVSTVPPTPRVVSVGDGDGGVSFPLCPLLARGPLDMSC